MTGAIIWTIVVLAVLAIIVIALFARFYQRATREISLVKTGVGGRRIIIDGGTVAIPMFHEIARVNMQTMRLEVRRSGEAALITKDRLRVDVGVEFYVSVTPTEEGISRAAQTLGGRTFAPEKLRELIEGKLVDALRSVAARMTMDELHENRGKFVAEVREGLVESLSRNGLEIESVSLTALDQTPFGALEENNVFNAVGMRRLAEVIAKAKKERAEIDADAEVSVRRAAVDAVKRKYQIDLEEKEAEIAQVQQIESLKAAQLAEVARRKAEGERAAAQARIAMEQEIRAADIASQQAIREAEIERDKRIQEAEIERQRDIDIANQEHQIAVAAKSREESKARAEADQARIQVIKAAEAMTTARQVAEAERRKEIAILAAQQEGQVAGSRLRMAAQAEKEAAGDRARATVDLAKAEADSLIIRADARKKELLAEAEGKKANVQAENMLDMRVAAYKTDLARFEMLPRLVAEMVKPAEKIDSIKIHHVSGLGTGSFYPADGGSTAGKPVVNQALDSIMEMAVQLPALKKLGEELGLSLDSSLAGLSDSGAPQRKKNKAPGGKGKDR